MEKIHQNYNFVTILYFCEISLDLDSLRAKYVENIAIRIHQLASRFNCPTSTICVRPRQRCGPCRTGRTISM